MTHSDEQIAQLRSFNRTVTRRIGVLQDRFLGRDRPLGESRLLFEIGVEGSDVRSLRTRLGLDSGYASRLLRSLEKQGLVKTGTSPGDARVRVASLTAKGRKEHQMLDRLSDNVASSILDGLDESRRIQLTQAMRRVETLLQASETVIKIVPANNTLAQWCLEQYYILLNDRFEQGYDPGNAQPADHVDFEPPNGVFLIAQHGDEPVGCIGLRSVAHGAGEIKRLWVADSARGLGLGQRLLDACESHARSMGLKTLQLDTNKTLTEAKALYIKNGYVEVPPFNNDPYPDFWFEKPL